MRNLAIVALLPALLAFALGGRVEGPVFAFVGMLPALLLGLVPYADVAFDGTAFATVLATGIRGRADRAGRLLAAATVGVPLVIAVAVITVGFSGEWTLLPGVLGTCVGALLVGLGICAVSSAYIVIPVPASGRQHLQTRARLHLHDRSRALGADDPGGGLVLPSFGSCSRRHRLGRPASWAALVVGIGIGVGVALGGIAWGGRIFDGTGPLLLARVRATVGY